MSLARVYPIVDSAAWIARLSGPGVRLVQLRIKDTPLARVRAEVRAARAHCAARAMCAVVTASLTEWQPAVLGSTRTESSRISDQKACPERSPPDSRRRATVTTSARAARTAAARTAGEG